MKRDTKPDELLRPLSPEEYERAPGLTREQVEAALVKGRDDLRRLRALRGGWRVSRDRRRWR